MSKQPTSGTSRGAPLSSAVSSLVRAQYGLTSRSSAGESTTDLDKHVAELLLQEAKEREARAKASNSATAWSFSDDEDGNSKQYTSRTNKRFLKNMLKGVEEHNAPLRRKEESNRESLDDIRRREREARERRTGIGDAERAGKNAATTSTSSTATASASGERRPPGPGFAARMLANGLSGAVASRVEKEREDKGVKDAIDDARRRADKHSERESRSNNKGKERERDYDDIDERRSHRQRSNSRDREKHHSSRSRFRPDQFSDGSDSDRRQRRDRKYKDRSRSPGTAKPTKDEGHRSKDDGRYDGKTTSGRDREKDERRSRDRTRSVERGRGSSIKRSKRRSPSTDSSSPSEHASEASSDIFIDYTGAAGTGESSANVAGGGSKMDKYFSSNYNPALDISVSDLEDPKTGLIGEANFSEWDKMLQTLKKRKEDKLSGVTQAREEEKERQLRKMERRRRREERELRHALKKEKKRKKRRRTERESDSASDSSIGPKQSSSRKDRKRSTEPGKVVIDGYEYGKRGSTRAWDLGKDSTPT